MRRKGLEPMHSDHVNVTPLIDVIMCLIIFFLLCGQFAKQEASDQVRIPRADLGQEMADQRGRLLINVVPNGAAAPDVVIRAAVIRPDNLAAYLRREKAENPDVKVIMTSGYNEQDIISRFVGKGLAGFVQKPYTSGDLLPKIRETLGE